MPPADPQRKKPKVRRKNKLVGASGSGQAGVGVSAKGDASKKASAPKRHAAPKAAPKSAPKPVAVKPARASKPLAGITGKGTARVGVKAKGNVKKKGGGLPVAAISTENLGRFLLAANPVTGAASTIAHAVGGTPKKIVENASKELIDIPLNTPASMYHLVDTAIHDPKKAASEIVQPYIELVKHPGKELVDHPLGSALLFGGLKGGGGRGLGAAMRKSPSKTMRAAASTERAAKTVPGTELKEIRKYSPDVTKKAVQVAKEKRALKRVAKGKPDPRVMTGPEIRRRVDEHVAASEDVRRAERTQAINAADAAVHDVKPGRKGKPQSKPSAATTLAVQGVARTTPELEAYLTRLEREADGLSGPELRANKTAQSDVRAAIKRGPDNAAADRYVREVSLPGQKKLADRGLVDAGQAERARLIPYAVTKMGAKFDGETIVDSSGKRTLSNHEIREHMASTGTPEPGYVTNAPNQRGAKNFYVPTHEPPRVASGKRTGAAIRRGTTDLHPDVLVEAAAKTQGLITAADRYAAYLKEFGSRGKTGKVRQFQTYKQAQKAAAEALVGPDGELIPGAVEMRPVQLNPFAGKGEQLQATLEHANSDMSAKTISEAIDSALSGDDGVGPWTLVPKDAADQMRHHIRVTGTGVPGKTANVVGSRFRTAVLATNPKWLVGNSVEAAARALVSGAGPTSYMLGRGALKRLEKTDPAAAIEAKSRMVGGGHMAMTKRVQTFSHAEQYAGTKLAGIATGLGKFWQTPGPKQLAQVWHGYTDFVFNTLNGRIESQFQTAMLGKALKKSPLMTDRMVKLSKTAMDEAAAGLRDTNAQVALGREVDRMYGNYGKFSPTYRHMVAGYTPFIAWAVNATNFLARVLPADHPVLTSVLASANQASEDWRREHGLKFGEKDAPYFLQGSIPVGGGKLPVSKFLPTGVASSPSGIPGVFAGSLLPQFQSVLENLQGKDWKGKDLPEGQNPILTAVVSLVEGSVPLVGQVSHTLDNPGTTGQKLEKTFNPAHVIKPKGAAAGGEPGKAGLPAGVSQREMDRLVRDAGAASAVPQVSQAEIDALLKAAGGK